MSLIDRSIKPGSSGKIKISLPNIELFHVGTDIPFYMVHKTDLPIVNLRFIFNCGSKTDPKLKTGLSYITSMLLDEGAGGLSTFEIDAAFEKLGSGFSISTSQDSIFISLLTLNENVEASLELLAKVINEPTFSQESFDIEKHKLFNRIKRKNDDPGYIANNSFENHLFKNTGYEHPPLGYSDDVTNLGNDDVTEFYKKYLVRENLTILAATSITPEKLVKLVEKHIYPVQKGEKLVESIKLPDEEAGRFIFVHKENAAQSEIRIGHRTGLRGEENYYSKILLNTIFGGQFSSRLNLNLREDKGYTYGIHSGFNYYREAGFFEITTSVQGKVTHDAVTEIMKEINKIYSGVTEGELTFAKSYLIRRFPSLFETYGQLINHLTAMINFDLPRDYFSTYLDNIRAVSIDEVNFATGLISTERLNTVIVGNKDIALEKFENAEGMNFKPGNIKNI